MLTLKIETMTINGHSYRCPECASEAFTLDGAGFIDRMPVRGNCWNSHSWEEPLITVGDLRQIQTSSTGRQRAEDQDTFEITIGRAVLAGILYPQPTLDDLKKGASVYWGRIVKPALRRRRRTALRAAKRPVSNAVAHAKAAAIGAAWGLQTGETDPDYQPEPVNPCAACDGRGKFTITSNVHGTTTVRCAVCHGTGEID